jgi:hypothetical protein
MHITLRFVQVWRKEAQSSLVRYWAVARAEEHSLAFGSYHYHLYLYSDFCSGLNGILIPHLHKALPLGDTQKRNVLNFESILIK